MPQLWQGRASKAVDSRVNDFNSSIRFDARMIEQDIQGSLVHSAMLGRQGIISRQDVDDIHKGLHSILDDLHSGALEIDPNAEDVHTFVEQTLTARVGDAGKRLHTGRSRNDQVALDIRLNLRAASEHIQDQIKELITVLCDQAEKGAGYVMPGYTHLQRAQPVTFGHQLMAYAWMLLRDLGRLQDATRRMDAECPLGSGALAGTTYPLDRFYTAEQLGFAAPCGNSIDGVSDRDFCIELCSAMATCMMHLSRLSEEIILWCSWEFKFIELDDAFTTGSSIMPQKKNPDVTELIRGKTGRVYGDLNTLLVMMKGIPLAYDKDMQEDKEAIFDAVDTLELCLRTVTPMLATMTPLPANMRRAAAKGFINATDCADYLTKKGMPFRDAYKCTGTMVAACIREGKTLEELTLDEFKQYSDLFEDDVYTAIDLTTCCEGRTSYGGPRDEFEILKISEADRKDVRARAAVINESDLSFLCLPDDAAREVVPLLRDDVRILDTSTAHRTAPGWVYGLPELHGTREALKTATRVAVPGCHATGFIAPVAPLVELGIIPKAAHLNVTSLTGYSGGGKKMIAEYEAERTNKALNAPRPYGLALHHKHLPEMAAVTGLDTAPNFVPVVADYYAGMETMIPLDVTALGVSAPQVASALAEYYDGQPMVKVHPLCEGTDGGFLAANKLAGKDTLEIYCLANPDGTRMQLISLFDNLGKGSSGAAVQCMNLMLGLEETKGLAR